MGANIGYARCSTTRQDLTAQREQLATLGVPATRIYLDKGLTGTSRARPGLDQALAAVRDGDTFTVTKLDRLARSVPDALDILGQLSARGIRFALGTSVYDWQDPFARMFLQILAVIAEFEAGLIRQRTREGMAIARSRGKLRGKPPKLSPAQAREVHRMHASGDYPITEIAELFNVSRPTIYRVLQRPSGSARAARRHPATARRLRIRRIAALTPASRRRLARDGLRHIAPINHRHLPTKVTRPA